MTTKFLLLVSIVLIAALGISCDVGVNPLLWDGTPVTATFRVDKAGSSYDTTISVNLNHIIADIDEDIDSIKVFNVTLQIDSTAGTDSSTTFTGSAIIDGDTLLTVTNGSIRQFATERSIFDTTLTGGPIFNNTGVAYVIALLKEYKRPDHTYLRTVTLRSWGQASTSPLHFTIKLRLYTQVFLPPPSS